MLCNIQSAILVYTKEKEIMELIITLILMINAVVGWFDYSKRKVSIAIPLMWNAVQLAWFYVYGF